MNNSGFFYFEVSFAGLLFSLLLLVAIPAFGSFIWQADHTLMSREALSYGQECINRWKTAGIPERLDQQFFFEIHERLLTPTLVEGEFVISWTEGHFGKRELKLYGYRVVSH